MCDASFIPLNLIKEQLERFPGELTQEDYINLREEIGKGNPNIDERIQKVLEDTSGHENLKGKEKFEGRLIYYASAQMEYNERRKSLEDITTNFLDQLLQKRVQQPLQHQIKERLSTIERHLSGYYATWILDIGLKSGLFAAIAEAEPVTNIEELSWQLELTPLYVEIWCRAAYGLELLDIEINSKGYKLASGLKELLLDPTHPTSMRFDIAFSTMLHQDFSVFPTYLKTGAVWPLANRPAELHKLYMEATLDDYPVITDVILPFTIGQNEVERLKKLNNYRILDVGTGAGFALIHYAKFFSQAKVIGLDIDPSRVAEAYHTIQSAVTNPNLKNHNIEVRCQDVNKLEEPKEDEKCDLIIFNLVLYQIRFSDYQNVFDRIYKALKPDGILVISEYNFPALAPERTYRFPGYQSFLSNLLHFALIGATMVPSQKLVEMLKEHYFEVIGDEAMHHPLEERQVIVAKKGASPSLRDVFEPEN